MLLLVWLSLGMMVTLLVLVVPSLEAGEYTEPAMKSSGQSHWSLVGYNQSGPLSLVKVLRGCALIGGEHGVVDSCSLRP